MGIYRGVRFKEEDKIEIKGVIISLEIYSWNLF